jgi:hypothetical protein
LSDKFYTDKGKCSKNELSFCEFDYNIGMIVMDKSNTSSKSLEESKETMVSKQSEETKEAPAPTSEETEGSNEETDDLDLETVEEKAKRSYSNVYIWGIIKGITQFNKITQTKKVSVKPNWDTAPAEAKLINKRLSEGKKRDTYLKDPTKLKLWDTYFAKYEAYINRTKETALSHEDQLAEFVKIMKSKGIINEELSTLFMGTIESNDDTKMREKGLLEKKKKKEEKLEGEDVLD